MAYTQRKFNEVINLFTRYFG